MSEAARPKTGSALGLVPAFALLIAGSLSFGLVIALNRIATTAGVPYAAYVFWFSLIGGCLLLLIAVARGKPPGVTRAHLKYYLLTGFSAGTLSYLALAFIAPHVPAGIAALELTLAPMMVYALTVALGMDRFHRLRALGMALGAAGVLLIVLPETSLPDPRMVPWVLVGLIAPLPFALGLVAGERYFVPGADAVAVASGVMLAVALTTLPFVAISGQWWFFEGAFSAGHWAVLAAAPLTACAWIVTFVLLPRAGSVSYSVVAYLETLAGVGWGMVLFHETHSPYIWGALVLMFTGIYLVNRKGRLAGLETRPF